MIAKKNIQKVYFLFLAVHLILWTLIPSLTNVNLPLDTIEALAWSSNLDWGYNKHPPFSALAVEIFYVIFGNQDWAYYLLSQIFVITAFVIIFRLSREFFKDARLAFISLILLEGIFFYNYTTPEFNVNVSQIPFWALSVYFTWRCIKKDRPSDYVFLGIFISLGFLSKYLFIYLILGIKTLFLYLFFKKKIKSYNFLITGLVSLIIIFPHLIWLLENNFITLTYGLQRTSASNELLDHIIYPLVFIFKQLVILLPFFILSFFLIKRIKPKKIMFNEKIVFLIFTFLVPVLLMLITSIFIGGKIRTMWMTPFYLLIGICFIEIYKSNFEYYNLKKFFYIFLFIFFLSPITYASVSLINDFKRTDYPGKEIARLVQNKWDDNFSNDIKFVVGDEWYAGNLSYHLISRPRWLMELKDKSQELNINEGIIYTGNPKILKKICPGVFGTIKPVGYCMIGRR